MVEIAEKQKYKTTGTNLKNWRKNVKNSIKNVKTSGKMSDMYITLDFILLFGTRLLA